MHELAFAEQIFSSVSLHAEKHNAKRVMCVYLSVSVLSGIEIESFQFYWDILTKDTVLNGSKISIAVLPVHVRCTSCKTSFILRSYEDPIIQCKKCHSMKTVVSEQTAVTIDNIDIET